MDATKVWRAAAPLAIILGMAGCSGGGERTDGRQQPPASDAEFWSGMWITGDEVDLFGTLPDMASRSDAVILGHFGEVTGERVVGGPVDEGGVIYTQIEVVVDEVLSGAVPGDSITLESMVELTSESLPAGQMMLFAVDKGGDEAGLWRPLNSRGLWTTTERSAVDTPLNEEAPQDDPKYVDVVSDATSINDLVDDL